MVKKKNKKSKKSIRIKKTMEALQNNEEEKKSGITARLEKIKSADVFEGMSPEKHVDMLKQEVRSATSQQTQVLNHPNKGFPWTEFLIGFVLGGALLVVMFVFHVNFSKNVNKRIVNLENRLAMISPEVNAPDRDYLQIISQQQMFESEVNSFKRKIRHFPRSFSMGSETFEFSLEKTITGKIQFAKKFHRKPIVIAQVNSSKFSCSIHIDESLQFFTYEIHVAQDAKKGMYSLSWIVATQ